MQEEQEVVGGQGWHMLKHDQDTENSKVVGLVEAVERYGKKRSHNSENMMEGVEPTSDPNTAAPPVRRPEEHPLCLRYPP